MNRIMRIDLNHCKRFSFWSFSISVDKTLLFRKKYLDTDVKSPANVIRDTQQSPWEELHSCHSNQTSSGHKDTYSSLGYVANS